MLFDIFPIVMNNDQVFADPDPERWVLSDVNIIGIIVADSVSPPKLFRALFNVS